MVSPDVAGVSEPVLVDGRDIALPGGTLTSTVPYVAWYLGNPSAVTLNGDFTLEELRAIADHIEKHLA